MQQVDETKLFKRSVHLDLTIADRVAEVQRLEDIGATTVSEFVSHTWMRDPEGNDFCIVDTSDNRGAS